MGDAIKNYVIEKTHQPEAFRAGCLTVKITCNGPVVAKEFAELIISTVELLEAVGEGTEGCPNLVYQLVETAVIGEVAVFTVSGLTEAQVAACREQLAKRLFPGNAT